MFPSPVIVILLPCTTPPATLVCRVTVWSCWLKVVSVMLLHFTPQLTSGKWIS